MMYPPVWEIYLFLFTPLQPLLLSIEILNFETFREDSKWQLNTCIVSPFVKLQNYTVRDSYGHSGILKEKIICHTNFVFQYWCVASISTIQWLTKTIYDLPWFCELTGHFLLLHMMLPETKGIWKVRNGDTHMTAANGCWAKAFRWRISFSSRKDSPHSLPRFTWATFHSKQVTGTDQAQGDGKYTLPLDGRVARSHCKREHKTEYVVDKVEAIFENTIYRAYPHKSMH